jgi:hypothetical protein
LAEFGEEAADYAVGQALSGFAAIIVGFFAVGTAIVAARLARRAVRNVAEKASEIESGVRVAGGC